MTKNGPDKISTAQRKIVNKQKLMTSVTDGWTSDMKSALNLNLNPDM